MKKIALVFFIVTVVLFFFQIVSLAWANSETTTTSSSQPKTGEPESKNPNSQGNLQGDFQEKKLGLWEQFKNAFKSQKDLQLNKNTRGLTHGRITFDDTWKDNKIKGFFGFFRELFKDLHTGIEVIDTIGLGDMNEKLGESLTRTIFGDNPHGLVGDLYALGQDNYNVYVCSQKFEGKLLFDENNNLLSSGGQYPTFNGRNFAYIYGRRTVRAYDNDEDYPFATSYREPDGSLPRWFPGTDGPLGYLYKVSWNFAHPFTKEQIEKMSEEEKDAWGLNDDGVIYYQVVFEVGGENYRQFSKKRILRSKVRSIHPGSSGSGTISFYNLLYFTKVYLEFVDFNEEGKDVGMAFKYKQRSRTFPENLENIPLKSEKPVIGGFYELIPGESFDYGFDIENLPYSYSDGNVFQPGQNDGALPGTPNYDGANLATPIGGNEGSSQAQGDLGW